MSQNAPTPPTPPTTPAATPGRPGFAEYPQFERLNLDRQRAENRANEALAKLTTADAEAARWGSERDMLTKRAGTLLAETATLQASKDSLFEAVVNYVVRSTAIEGAGWRCLICNGPACTPAPPGGGVSCPAHGLRRALGPGHRFGVQ